MACTRVLQQQHSRQWGPAGPKCGVPSSGSASNGRDVGPCGYRAMTGPGAGTTCWSPDHFATRCYRRVDDLHRERFGPHAITPHWPSRLRQRTAAPVESHLPVLGPFPAARVKTCVSILGVNLVGVSHLHDLGVVTTFTLDEPVASCTVGATWEPLATFRREPRSGLFSLHTGSHHIGSGQVRSGQVRSGLPQSLASLPYSPTPPCTPCVEVRQHAAPHSSFPPTTAPLQTLHLDADVPTVLEPWLLARGDAQGLCGLRLHSDRGEHVEGGDTRAAGPGGAGSGGARGVRVDTFPVEDMAVSTRRPRPASPLGFPSVPQFSPRAALRPVTAEPGGVPTGGTGDTTGVVTGGSGSGGAGAGDTGSATPTPRTVRAAAAAAGGAVSLAVSGEGREGALDVGGGSGGGVTALSGESRGGVTAIGAGAAAAAAGEGRGGATGAAARTGAVAADTSGGGAAATARPARPSTCTLCPWSPTIPSCSPYRVPFLIPVDSAFSPQSCCVSRASLVSEIPLPFWILPASSHHSPSHLLPLVPSVCLALDSPYCSL
ncbi:unnamed protein product [Closterium sp. NIES-53]